MQTAGAVIIGDEILSGKVRDENTPYLIAMLARRGVRLGRIIVIGDEPDEIGAAVKAQADRYDYVFTSGGVGPTHDDRTVGAIAAAFGRTVVPHPELVDLLRREIGVAPDDPALKMAEVVDGTVLLGGGPYPILCFQNIFILPGVPQIFAAKIDAIAPTIGGAPLVVRRVYLDVRESQIARRLADLEAALDGVRIGSYPQWEHAEYRVLVTFEHADSAPVDEGVERLVASLADGELVRVE